MTTSVSIIGTKAQPAALCHSLTGHWSVPGQSQGLGPAKIWKHASKRPDSFAFRFVSIQLVNQVSQFLTSQELLYEGNQSNSARIVRVPEE